MPEPCVGSKWVRVLSFAGIVVCLVGLVVMNFNFCDWFTYYYNHDQRFK